MGKHRSLLIIVSLVIIIAVGVWTKFPPRDDTLHSGSIPSISESLSSSEAPALGRSSSGIPTDTESRADSQGGGESAPVRPPRIGTAPDLADSLPAERSFLTIGSQLDALEAKRQLQSEDFHRVVEQLALESIDSLEARELAEIYSEVMQSAISGALEGAVLEEFACGLRICVGTAEFNGGNAALLEFRRRVSAARDGPPIYIFAPALVPHPYGPSGTYQLRVLLSTDPESNSVVVMPP